MRSFSVIFCRFILLCLIFQFSIYKVQSQQWLGLNNSDSILSRSGGVSIGLDTPMFSNNAVHLAKHLIVRSAVNGDFADFVNEASNLEHGSDLIWAELCGPQPYNPGLFHINTKNGAYNNSVQNEIFIVRYNGNVGIGVLDPEYKLDVNGTIHTQEVVINQDNWPDYVFDEKYDLPELNILKGYIKQNRHLPDIPSSATIKRDGAKIGELTTILLKKVEELTLYIIQQQEEIDKLKKARVD